MGEIFSLQKRISAFYSSNRRKIYKICLSEKLNIKQLSEKLGISYNSTFENLKILEEAGLITKDKTAGSEAIISSVKLLPESIPYRVFQDFEKEDKEK